MALSKAFLQPTGITLTYHRIVRGIVDFADGKTTVEIASYLDASARASGKLPANGSSTTFDLMPTFTEDPRTWAYELLKGCVNWSDAKDV